ncbi:MAG: lipopolysaccharide heptosyltransferase I [Smithellaceae bacterium]
MNILIVKLSAIGDVIHTLPSLAALRELYPEAHITWVVEEAAAGLVNNHPLLNAVLISRRKSWIKYLRKGEFSRPLREMRAFLRELRKRPYDLVIDFHGLLKSALIVLLSGGKRKLGYDSMQELSGLFYNEKIPEDMNKHAVDRYLDFPRHLGAKIAKAQFILPSDNAAQTRIQSLLEKYHLENKKFIAVNPVAYWETKLWDDEKFAGLADLIKTKLNMEVVFTGSEKESIEKITTRMQAKAVNLAGETTLPELAYLYQKALLLVTTDSGPMHLAAAVGTPVVALFGPTDPQRTGPYGDGHIIIRSDLPCSPCLRKECPTTKCMQDILPEQVLAAIKERLRGL